MTASPDPPPRPEADLLSAALEYADQGIAIMPCAERGKKPALPRTGEAHAVATTDPDQIREWWTRNPNYNIGIACTANRLAVIDIDGEAGTDWIRDKQLPMPQTWTATTGRGFHYYYRWPAGQIIKTFRIAPKLEIRASGAYVVAPPSIHPDGETYEWAQSERCEWGDLPEAPAEWAALQPGAQHDNVVYLNGGGNTVALKRLAGLAKYLAEKPKGERHKALYTIARTLGQLVASEHLTRDQIHAQLYDAAQQNGLAAEDGGNVTRTINDGIEKGISDGPDPDHHETGDGNSYTLPPKGFTNGAPGRLCSWCEGTDSYLWRTPTGGEALCDTCREKHTKHASDLRRGPQPVDLHAVLAAGLTQIVPDVFWRQDARALMYRGRLNVIFGTPEAGKTWIGLIAIADLVKDAARTGKGIVAVFFDFEDDATSYLTRMRDAGADPKDVAKHTSYYSMATPIQTIEAGFPGADTADLIVVDTTNSAMTLDDLDPLGNKDALTFINHVRALKKGSDAAWLLMDHEPISTGAGRRQAIGAQSKLGAVDGAQYRAFAVQQPRPGHRGAIALYLTKDRPGGVRQWAANPDEHGIQHAATIFMNPTGTENGFTFSIVESQGVEGDAILRATILDVTGEWKSKNQIEELVRGKSIKRRATAIRDTVVVLAAEGFLDQEAKGNYVQYRKVTTPPPPPRPESGRTPSSQTGTNQLSDEVENVDPERENGFVRRPRDEADDHTSSHSIPMDGTKGTNQGLADDELPGPLVTLFDAGPLVLESKGGIANPPSPPFAAKSYSEDEPVRDGGESEADSAPVRAAGAASTQSPDAGPGEHTMDGEHDAELEAASTALQLEGISGEVVDSLGLVAAEAKIMALLNKEGPAR